MNKFIDARLGTAAGFGGRRVGSEVGWEESRLPYNQFSGLKKWGLDADWMGLYKEKGLAS